MEAAPVNIIQYFDGAKQGIIPLFQRPYSWERKDWKTLWEDVLAQYLPNDRTSHFMGAVVTVPVKTVPVGVTKHLVIDGQQRLTTVAILLCAIRNHPEADEPTRGIIGDLLQNRHYQPPDDLKLVPTQADRLAFDALVKGHDLAPYEESTVVDAYRYFVKQLEGKDGDDEPIHPRTVLEAIQQSLQVVMINLSATDDPYLIFESLNHKGKPLSEADLVRNYVLMRFQHSIAAGGEQEQVYHQLWSPMEAALKDQISEFLRHYGMRFGSNVRKGEVYTAFKASYEGIQSSEDVIAELKETKQCALAYERFSNPEMEENPEIGERLQRMIDLDSSVFFPLLLRVYRSWQKEEIDAEAVIRFLAHLESFYVRRLVCGVPTNALNKLTLEWCSHVPTETPDLWLAEKMSQGTGGRKWPTDVEFTDALIHGQIYPRRNIARYLLDNLERAFGHKEQAYLDAATIEHVLPQTLSEEWKIELGDDAAEKAGKWCDTLGNLTLTGYNPELGNDSFSQKKEILEESHYELSRGIVAQEQWSIAEIESRGGELAEMALLRWKHFPATERD
ncbi:MAG: DUF262 domain-containing protein [Terrimicrobiaceae bacterium]|nr:DUF262 domain-containing protein [Terrimicrobiaceae bacterium]